MIYSVEIRTDVEADTNEDAVRQAVALADKVDGKVTEVLDEDWNEVLF